MSKSYKHNINLKDIENYLRNIVSESIDRVNNDTATSHDIWVVKNIKLN